MKWSKAITYILSPIVAAFLVGILLTRLQWLGGMWFVIIVSMGLTKKRGN